MSDTSGSYNTAVGNGALLNLGMGWNNTAIGNFAGVYTNYGANNQTPTFGVYIGSYTTPLADGDTNEIVIGEGAAGNGSNSVTLGNSSITKTVLNGNVDIYGTGDTRASVYSPDTSAGNWTGYQLSGPGFAGGMFIQNSNKGLVTFWSSTNDVMNLSGTNVGIGTTNPSYILDVAGEARFTGNYTTSDARWKTDVKTIGDSLAKVSNLRGVTYKFKDGIKGKQFPKGTQVGLIAQEVEKVFPEVVQTDNEGYKSVNYGALAAPLIEAVKTLKADNEQLRADNNAMKSVLCELRPNAVFCKR